MKTKKGITFICFVITCWLFLSPPKSWARQVTKAFLTPNSATLWITEKLTVKGGTVHFNLPPQTDPATLRISIIQPSDAEITNITYRMVEERREKEVAELNKKIKELERDIASASAKHRAIKESTEAWIHQSKQKFEKSDEAVKFVSSLEKALLKLHEEMALLQENLKEKRKQLDRLKKQLEEIAGSKKKEWIIECNLSGVKDSLPVKLNYNFTIHNAGWKPRYFLDAYPREGKIRFSWLANIWQKTGFNWLNTDISIATSEVPEYISPPELPEWNVQVFEPLRHRESFMLMSKTSKAPDLMLANKETHQQVGITKEVKTGYKIYHIGRHDIPAGKTIPVQVEKETWQAKFEHLLRPFVSPWAFIRAETSFKEEMSFPRAETSIFLEGTYIGKESIEIFGSSKKFSFGPDKLVKAEMVVEQKQTGKTGFFKGKKSFLWKWAFIVSNQHNYKVSVRLEERKPMLSDQRIELKEVKIPHLPKAQNDKPDRWAWKFDLKPGEKKRLSFFVKILVPEKLEVDPGW